MRNQTGKCIAVLFVICITNTQLFAQDDALSSLPGQVAFIGTDLNVYHIDLSDAEQSQLTDDASIDAETLRFYQWPTWSTDGRLAYFQTTVSRTDQGAIRSVQLEAYISRDGASPAQQVYTGSNEIFQYAYWSPSNCGGTENCRDLAVLISGEREDARGLFIELIRDDFENTQSQSVGITPPPFYFSWSPDGSQLLWQRLASRLDIYDIDSQQISETLPSEPGLFQAPAWSPVDDRLMFGVRGPNARETDLVIFANNEIQTLASGLSGPIAFAWSPDGNMVAYTDRSSTLYVLDAVSGESMARSTTTGVLAFFWSPDSTRIAYITLATSSGGTSASAESGGVHAAYAQQTEPEIRWSILNVETGTTQQYGAFRPTDDMIYLLTYFDQFAQSHRVWSPDSNYLIYSQFVSGGQPIISVLDTSQRDSVPFAIANGQIGVWSYE